ncbi:hypothetical protein ACO4HP_005390, partial [Escherichia coli]
RCEFLSFSSVGYKRRNFVVIASSVLACWGLKNQRFQAPFRLVNILAWPFGNINPLELHGYAHTVDHEAVYGLNTTFHHELKTQCAEHAERLF